MLWASRKSSVGEGDNGLCSQLCVRSTQLLPQGMAVGEPGAEAGESVTSKKGGEMTVPGTRVHLVCSTEENLYN